MTKKTDGSFVEGFEWPEFNNERKRIKILSKRYKDLSIQEAFADYTGNPVMRTIENANYVPNELKVGDIIDTYILSVDKSKVVFDNGNYKTNFLSTTNLYKYNLFKQYLPLNPVKVEVLRMDKDKTFVDPISPIMKSWLTPILQDNSVQKNMINPQTIKVKNLQLTRGGFMGKAVIPSISEFVGEDYLMDAFIPGSQIVLNITDNFEQFVGKDVDAFVVNYTPKPGDLSKMYLICSAKEVIKFEGEKNLINLFNSWCEESDYWKTQSEKSWNGRVTGIINTSKKCGVFVEIPELNITGMVKANPDELVNYKPHTDTMVKITGFEEDTYYNNIAKQIQHTEPYIIEDNVLKKCNIKPILEFA